MAAKGTLTVRILGDDSHLQKTVGSAGSGFKKLGSLALKAGALLGGAGLAGGFALAVSEAREAAKIGRLTEAVIKSTGGAANVTAKQVGSYAEQLSNLTGIDDEAIQGGENLLLTFTKVRNEVGKGNDIFDQATKAALNMSVALGTDMNSASMLLGKALNDPIKGMTALTRSGVSFTQQQKDQVKAMVEAGDVLGAQKLILGEMETQFGGAAEAAADPMQKLQTIAGNLMERLGTSLLPVIEKVATWLGKNLPAAVTRLSDVFGPLIDNVQMAWDLFKWAFTDPDVTSDGWQGVIERIGVAVRNFVDGARDIISGFISFFQGDAVGGVEGAASRFSEIVGQLKETFSSAFDAIRAIVETAVKIITEIWDRFGATLLDRLKAFVGPIQDTVSGMLAVLSGIFDLIKAVLTGKWGEAWDAIKKILGGAWDAIGGMIRNAFALIALAFEAFKAAISALWSLIWNSLKTVASDALGAVVGAVGGLPGRILGFAGAMLGAGAGLGGKFLDGLKKGLTAAAGFAGDIAAGIVQVVKNAWNAVAGMINDFVPNSIGWGPFKLDLPDNPIPRFHTGGTFRSATSGGEGLALLRDNERVVTPEAPSEPAIVRLDPGQLRELARMVTMMARAS